MSVSALPIVIGTLGMVPKGLKRQLEEVGNHRINQDFPKNSIV